MAILLASRKVPVNFGKYQTFVGELGLDGSTRPLRGIIGKILVGRQHGIDTIYIPSATLSKAQLVPNVTLVPIDTLANFYKLLIIPPTSSRLKLDPAPTTPKLLVTTPWRR